MADSGAGRGRDPDAILHGVVDPAAQKSPVVLIVDDDPSIRRALGGVLRHHRFATAEATTVAAAIAAAGHQPLAAVVLDLTLEHGESGLDFLTWLREHPDHAKTPVLILTGRATLEEGDRDLIQRFRAYVFYKPISMTVLAEFLTRLTMGHGSGSIPVEG